MVSSKGIIKIAQAIENEKNYKSLFLRFISNDVELYNDFSKKIENAKHCLKRDLDFFIESDPAADSKEEIIACYPGYKAIMYYRIAHCLYELNKKIEARIISEQAHFLTGIDIHPGAQIGCPFFIDHGTGIVIGETAEVGERCKIYQGVTLGALSLSKGSQLKGTKRHPTIGNDVIIYSGASILGGEVFIGDRTVIGSSVFIIESIPNDTKVSLAKPELSILKKPRVKK